MNIKQAKEQIAKIEERRIQLAEARNIIKKYVSISSKI